MKYTLLGNTKQKVPLIGQGCMGIGGEFNYDTSRDQEQIKALQLGIDLGMTLIDTAEVYGAGHSEEVVGKAIEGRRDQVFIATKFSPENNSYANVLKSAEASLKKLNIDCIDLYQIHWPNPIIPIEETMRAMEKLIFDGKIKYIGLSNFSNLESQEAQSFLQSTKIVSNQVEYNLFDRFIEQSILPYCTSNKMSLIAYSPLDKGKFGSRQELLQKIANNYGKTTAQVTLNWLVNHAHVIVIPKAINPIHIRQNATALDFTISESDSKLIDQIFTAEPKKINTDKICVSLKGDGNRKAYQTIEEALENHLQFTPSPLDLSKSILSGEPIKPVRLVKNDDSNNQEYSLIEGRIRYWAWVIAHRNNKKPIPAYIRN